jgi:hypothetical protein
MAKPDDRDVDPEVRGALSQLSPEEALRVLDILERGLKRRKIQLWGYLTAAVVLIIGTAASLAYYGSQEEGRFVGWTFILPIVFCSIVLVAFGRWSDRYKTEVDEIAEKRRSQRDSASQTRGGKPQP